ncbi:MAG: TfoX/Sxy family protein [Candidatus Rokuibacteriota bacterium]
MNTSTDFRDFVLDQLGGLGLVACRRLFGGYGLYLGETFFAILYRNRVYFKTDAASRADYVAAGMGRFRPRAGKTLKNYYEVPVDVMEDADRLAVWARAATALKRDTAAACPPSP